MAKVLAAAAGCAFVVSTFAIAQAHDFSRDPSFELLGRYTTGLANAGEEVSAGETAALRNGRLYVTNANDVSLDIVDVRNPRAPRLRKRVDLSAYGGQVNSVAVNWLGLVAVAVQANVKTDPGAVVFLGPEGAVLSTAEVGALPDMVTFTPDGRKLLVANEGEPNCYYDAEDCPDAKDPEGSVSIVDLWPNPGRPRVTTVGFGDVALPAGVRIFGPNATQAQDLEPEYIAVSDDGRTAYVTLQENNAIAEIDIRSASVTAVRALGYKDFNAPPEVAVYEVANLPQIGMTAAGQPLKLGGFSGLFYEGATDDGKLKFVANTDRGPNGEPTGVLRPFLLPQFSPQIVRLTLDPDTGSVEITQQLPLRRADGSPLTGLPNTAIAGGNGNTAYNDEVPVDLFGSVLPLDELGGDFEGIVVDSDGTFWLCDEYRPAIYHFDAAARLLARYVPIGTHAAAGAVVPAAGMAGSLGIEALPAVLAQRRQNRGFEALAMHNGKLYAFVQSPLRNPSTLGNGTLNGLKSVRLVELDPATLATRQFIYPIDSPSSTSADDSIADKIGDATALPGAGFLVVERDDDAAPEDAIETITKKVYAFNLNGATDITAKDALYDIGGTPKSLDQMTPAELALPAVNVTPIAKVLHVDLAQTAYNTVEKVEGLALVDANTLAVINDNDFGVAGISIDQATGTFELLPSYQPEPALLGLIHTQGLDASDRDNLINIRNWPAYGMYQPDAIATFTVRGRRYLATANEGDSRDYDGFSEESRARDVRSLYPGVPDVADNTKLGRLTITTAPPGGDLTRPYVFGARSFSIWDAHTGAQVADSGADLEALTAAADPFFFNSDNAENNFDNRSDNKGPEPEGIDVGAINGRQYAFVGLERVGGVAVFDVSDPEAPAAVDYLVSRDFNADPVGPDAGPEIVHFVSAFDSPTGKPLILVANEISGTVSLWGVADARPRWHRPWHRLWRSHRRF